MKKLDQELLMAGLQMIERLTKKKYDVASAFTGNFKVPYVPYPLTLVKTGVHMMKYIDTCIDELFDSVVDTFNNIFKNILEKDVYPFKVDEKSLRDKFNKIYADKSLEISEYTVSDIEYFNIDLSYVSADNHEALITYIKSELQSITRAIIDTFVSLIIKENDNVTVEVPSTPVAETEVVSTSVSNVAAKLLDAAKEKEDPAKELTAVGTISSNPVTTVGDLFNIVKSNDDTSFKLKFDLNTFNANEENFDMVNKIVQAIMTEGDKLTFSAMISFFVEAIQAEIDQSQDNNTDADFGIQKDIVTKYLNILNKAISEGLEYDDIIKLIEQENFTYNGVSISDMLIYALKMIKDPYDVLVTMLADGEEIDETKLLTIVSSGLENMEKIVNDKLEQAKIVADNMELNYVPQNQAPVIQPTYFDPSSTMMPVQQPIYYSPLVTFDTSYDHMNHTYDYQDDVESEQTVNMVEEHANTTDNVEHVTESVEEEHVEVLAASVEEVLPEVQAEVETVVEDLVNETTEPEVEKEDIVEEILERIVPVTKHKNSMADMLGQANPSPQISVPKFNKEINKYIDCFAKLPESEHDALGNSLLMAIDAIKRYDKKLKNNKPTRFALDTDRVLDGKNFILDRIDDAGCYYSMDSEDYIAVKVDNGIANLLTYMDLLNK